MRGADEQPGSMFSYVSLEERVPRDHPLRAIRHITDRALEPILNTPEEFARFLVADRIVSKRVVDEAGLQPQ